MSIFIEKLYLKKYCGFPEAEIDFTDSDKNLKSLSLFLSPNGIGKSSVLGAIRMLSSPWQYIGRDADLLLRKITYNTDYDPSNVGFVESKGMEIIGHFLVNNEKKIVKIENTDNFVGVSKCEIEKPTNGTQSSWAFFVDADNPVNINKFQINDKYAEKFLEMAEAIYGYKCELPGGFKETIDHDEETGEDILFRTDFVLYKPNKTKVHFRSMSAGEKKIATMLAMLCSPLHLDHYDIFLLDNISLHIYFKRHPILIDKLLEHFKGKQIIATDHSGVLIDYIGKKYGTTYLYDLEEIIKGE